MGRVLDEAGVEKAELDEVVLAGGTSRIPKVRGLSRVWPCSHRNVWASLHLLGQPNAFLATVMSKLAQKLGQLQPFMPVFPLECMGQLASLGQPEAFRTHCVPKVRELLREFFGGKEPHMSIAPDEVAAHGAAVQAEAQVRKAPSWPRSRANFSRL